MWDICSVNIARAHMEHRQNDIFRLIEFENIVVSVNHE